MAEGSQKTADDLERVFHILLTDRPDAALVHDMTRGAAKEAGSRASPESRQGRVHVSQARHTDQHAAIYPRLLPSPMRIGQRPGSVQSHRAIRPSTLAKAGAFGL